MLRKAPTLLPSCGLPGWIGTANLSRSPLAAGGRVLVHVFPGARDHETLAHRLSRLPHARGGEGGHQQKGVTPQRCASAGVHRLARPSGNCQTDHLWRSGQSDSAGGGGEKARLASTDALGVVRNLPACLAGAALDPVVVALVGDLQQHPKHGAHRSRRRTRTALGGEGSSGRTGRCDEHGRRQARANPRRRRRTVPPNIRF
jgi:hypothetical protein